MAMHVIKKRKKAHLPFATTIQQDSGHHSESSAADTSTNSSAGSDTEERRQTSLRKDGRRFQNPRPQPGRQAIGGIYNTDVFQIQLGELLAEVRPNYEKKGGQIAEPLRKLKEIIENIAPMKPLPVRLAALRPLLLRL